MARPIPDMDQMTAAEVATDDSIIIDDTSAGETKRINVGDLVGLPVVGWTAAGETWSYSSWSATTRVGVFTVPTNATLKYTAGMRVRITQSTGGVKYGIILAVATTSLTVLFPSGVTFNNETITNPYYSVQKSPYGFDANPALWQLSFTSASGFTKASPTANVWYLCTGHTLVVPVGAWNLRYTISIGGTRASASGIRLKSTLATASSSETDSDLTSYSGATSNTIFVAEITRQKDYTHVAQTTYYLNILTTVSTMDDIQLLGSQGNSRIIAQCAYL
jgi:hypothetical protein